MSGIIPRILSTIATQAFAHPIEAAGGVFIIGGFTMLACKISMKIHRFVVGFIAGMSLGTLFVASELLKITPFVTVNYEIPSIALVILGSGFLGGFGMLSK